MRSESYLTILPELEVKEKNVEAMKRQSEGLTSEYDSLLARHEELEVRVRDCRCCFVVVTIFAPQKKHNKLVDQKPDRKND